MGCCHILGRIIPARLFQYILDCDSSITEHRQDLQMQNILWYLLWYRQLAPRRLRQRSDILAIFALFTGHSFWFAQRKLGRALRSRIIPKEEINFRIIFSVDIVLVSENDQSYGLPGLDDAEKIKCGINQRDCERERGGETQPRDGQDHL